MADLTHFDQDGRARMVDVGSKPATSRRAVAAGQITMAGETLEKIRSGGFGKGDVLALARIAGIMGAKQTASLIPLCLRWDSIMLRLISRLMMICQG